jgi:hypothetical protein
VLCEPELDDPGPVLEAWLDVTDEADEEAVVDNEDLAEEPAAPVDAAEDDDEPAVVWLPEAMELVALRPEELPMAMVDDELDAPVVPVADPVEQAAKASPARRTTQPRGKWRS